MAIFIAGVDRIGEPDMFRVSWESSTDSGSFRIYARDELDAYTKALRIIEEKNKAMKYFIIAAATVIIFLILSTAVVSIYSRIAYAQNMRACVAADKSYVSENDGYSCRTGTPPNGNPPRKVR